MNLKACKILADKDRISEFGKILSKISKLTEENNVNQSLILAARFLKTKNLENIFISIEKITSIEGSIPNLIYQYRIKKQKELYIIALNKFGQEKGRIFIECF